MDRRGSPRARRASAENDAERDESVNPGMVAVCDQRGTVETPTGTKPNLSRDLVPDEAERTGGGQRPQIGKLLRVDESLDRLPERHTSRNEDRKHDGVSGPAFCAGAPKDESGSDGKSREGVTRVMNEVSEQRDAPREHVDTDLRERRLPEHGEADQDRWRPSRERTTDGSIGPCEWPWRGCSCPWWCPVSRLRRCAAYV